MDQSVAVELETTNYKKKNNLYSTRKSQFKNGGSSKHIIVYMYS